MNEASVIQYITDTFEGIESVTIDSTGDTFFFYDPDHKFPFATLVTTDYNDSFSNLNRPSVFRLNIGISKQTYLSLFGSRPSQPSSSGDGDADGGGHDYDFTALDQLMPHPVYGRMYWVCVLNPSDATFETVVRPLLAEAYEKDVSKYAKRAARRRG
jgi:hypothetical protein